MKIQLLIFAFLTLFLSGCINWHEGVKRSLYENSEQAKQGKTYSEYTEEQDKAKEDYEMTKTGKGNTEKAS